MTRIKRALPFIVGFGFACVVAVIFWVPYMGANAEKNPSSTMELQPGGDRPAHLRGDLAAVDWKAKDDAFWRSVLTPEQMSVCRGAGTERPYTGKYCKTQSDGDYYCVCCGQLLFKGSDKFDSGTGWPSFTEAGVEGALSYIEDHSHGMHRTEVRCSRCDAHLGHVFDDGPPPSHKRYCINSVCLFKE